MKSRYESKLLGAIGAPSVLALSIAAFFFLGLYSGDHRLSSVDAELAHATRTTSSIESAIRLLRRNDTKDFLWVLDGLCSGADDGSGAVLSPSARESLKNLAFPIAKIVARARSEICKPGAPPADGLTILSERHPYLFPYLVVHYADAQAGISRLAMLSLEELGFGSSGEAYAILNGRGGIEWSSVSGPERSDLFRRIGLSEDDLRNAVASRTFGKTPEIAFYSGGFLASSPFLGRTFVAFDTEAGAFGPLRYIRIQTLWLLGAFIFAGLFLARAMAARMTGPLRSLEAAATRIGEGDLSAQVPIEGDPEFRKVQAVFNGMVMRVRSLLEETRALSKLEAEIELAEEVQSMLIPPRHVEHARHEIRSWVKNAEECGGDWWGSFEVTNPAGELAVVLMIGDVTGHGAPSALITAAAQGSSAILKAWVSEHPALLEDPRRLLELFNRSIHESSRGLLSMSFLVTVLWPSRSRLVLANAGHNWPYLLTSEEGRGRRVQAIGAASPVLGANPDEKFERMETHPWSPGSRIFLYTDGLTDCFRDGANLYDRRALIRFLKGSTARTPERMIEDLLRERDEKISGLKPVDDVTVVVCEYRSEAGA